MRSLGSEDSYSRRERFWLWALAAFGLFGVNGTYIYGLVIRPDMLEVAMGNPVAVAFMVEALALVGVFAYLFTQWGVGRLGWPWFVALSLLGSLAFAVPVVLLTTDGREHRRCGRLGRMLDGHLGGRAPP